MFQEVLPQYQIKVLSVDKPHMITFAGDRMQEKKILLIQVDDHYHGCNSYGGFLDTSYFCHHCNMGYNNEDSDHHPCRILEVSF